MENNSTWTLFQHFGLYVIALLQKKKKKKPIYHLPRWSLPYFVENANETSQQLKDNYLITTWTGPQERRTLTEFPDKCESLSWDKSHVLKAVFETISQFFSGTFSWIYIQFLASETDRNIKKDLLKKFRPCISSKDCLRVFSFRD